ncbi:hypothetical protein MATR_24240 [Marivirga tractuosa]|uniref:DUF5683 domain-containing protein n=1 Tax=Marivirga tractuosa (strain ATCC 23168 / DSM 4126 / NBRC 15989 / NCIMB 1408 / VKM B-1430 / H-43) TaxID=643867 RepID=E4TR68_MARTH|nr:DUF5683 domain-containing protein [Marivirga tractuosa]ADR23720.1 hypothetical protein Ftrac_3753 [Marivirga tractuosa DSM 4126]BDD15599.1 hypothetical protein MATR_24240 [Marivirga tractuosa]
MRNLLFITIFFIFASIAKSQEVQPTDSTFLRLGADTEEIESFQTQDTTHSPRLAALYSAIVPGMGQFYNEKYWKIPVVYALGALAAYQIKSNHQNYLLFRNVFINLADEYDANNSEIQDFINLGYDEDRADRLLQRFERDRDYWIILAGLFYVLNIVDATVDAHLREFNINQDLSLNIQPSIQSSPYSNMHAGLSLNFRLK